MLQGQSRPIYVLLVSQSSNLSQFWSKASRFHINSNLETSAPKDPQMTLNTKRSKVPDIYYNYP